MEITYYTDGDKTISVMKGDKPEGIKWNLFNAVLFDPYVSSPDRQILENFSTLHGSSSPCVNDEYVAETGHNVARDKVILKQCKRDTKKLNIIKNWLESNLEHVNLLLERLEKKKNKAEERMSVVKQMR